MQKISTLTLLASFLRNAWDWIMTLAIKVSGRWYCDYCEKTHSPRVVGYDYAQGMAPPICSKGLEAAGIVLDGSEEQAGPAEYRIYLEWDVMVKAAEKMRRSKNDH